MLLDSYNEGLYIINNEFFVVKKYLSWDQLSFELVTVLKFHPMIKLFMRTSSHELLNLRALKFLTLYKNLHLSMYGQDIWVEFQREPLELHSKYLTHTLQMMILYNVEKFKSFQI